MTAAQKRAFVLRMAKARAAAPKKNPTQGELKKLKTGMQKAAAKLKKVLKRPKKNPRKKLTGAAKAAFLKRMASGRKKNAGTKRKRAGKRAPGAKRKRNPGQAEELAVQRYVEFHGEEPGKVYTIKSKDKLKTPGKLSGVGFLKGLSIVSLASGEEIPLNGFKGALLARDPKTGDQLYIEGGDQSVPLKRFGFDDPKEIETLGPITSIVYNTTKKHLEDGGKGDYEHDFGTDRRGDRHVRLNKARLPLAVYDTRNKQITIAGGSYTIDEEGIRG